MENFVAWLGVLLAISMPFAAFAIVVHVLERIGQTQLAQRFGWKSVMWTGWLGTPIHELSHVAMCLLFRHRIDKVALFQPDKKSGRLGYVHHSYRSNSWFEELGNPLIAIAPLIGGSLVLLILVNVFYGHAAAVEPLNATQNTHASQYGLIQSVRNVLGNVFRPEHFATTRFWVFIYLVLCVGSHMAPSRTDYYGAGKGALMIGVAIAVSTVVLAMLMRPPQDLVARVNEFFSPLFAMFITIGLLLSFATLVITFAVQFFPQRYVAN